MHVEQQDILVTMYMVTVVRLKFHYIHGVWSTKTKNLEHEISIHKTMQEAKGHIMCLVKLTQRNIGKTYKSSNKSSNNFSRCHLTQSDNPSGTNISTVSVGRTIQGCTRTVRRGFIPYFDHVVVLLSKKKHAIVQDVVRLLIL